MSWNSVPLGDVCSIVNGGTPKSEVSEYWDGDLNWITPKEMGKLLSREISTTERKITSLGLKNSSAKLLPINSVILSSRAPIGHLAINKNLMATNQGCKGLVPSGALSYEYLYYFLSHSKKLLNDLGSGATFKELSGSKLAMVDIPLPPLTIQKKIVAKLDAIFFEIDKATLAVEANVKNSEALFQSYLRQIFSGDIDWTTSSLGNCFELYQPQTITTKDLLEDGKYDVYGANGVIGRYNKFNHEEPQLLVTCRGATCGAVNVSSPFSWINGNAMVVKPKTDKISLKFTEYFFRGAVDLTKAITGAAQPQITRQSLSPVSFSYPSTDIQLKLVRKLEIFSDEITKSIQSYKGKLINLSILKQSILKQAFNGELVKE